MSKSKNNKSDSLKIKLLLAFLASSFLIYVFYSDISQLFKKDISGCTDINALNYDPLATLNDSTCYFPGALPNHLKKDIDKLKYSEWIKNDYLVLKDKIKIHFSSNDKENGQEENISLNNLDLAYMYVLDQASTKEVENCFQSGNNLSSEVYSFWKEFKSKNNDIRNAQYKFNKKYQIYSNKRKVKEILRDKYNENTFDDLENKIEDFKKSPIFIEFKKCSKLSQIIENCENDLIKFKQIDKDFKSWKIKNKFSNATAKKLSKPFLNKYSKYKWYHDVLLLEDKRLRDREIKRLEKIKKREADKKNKADLELK